MDRNEWDTFRSVGAESDEVVPAGKSHELKSQIAPWLSGGPDRPTPNQFGSAGPSRRSCRLLNLLFEDEDALPLLRGQHGDLLWGQLQNLHDESSLEDKNRKKGANITPHTHTHRRIKHLKLKSKVCFSGLMRHLFSLCCTIKKTNNPFKKLCCHLQLLFLKLAFSPRSVYLKGDATQDDLQLVKESRNEEWFCLRFLATRL